MNNTRVKLAGLGALAVIATLVAAAVAYNLFATWKVQEDAIADLAYALSLDDEAVSTGRSPNYVMLDDTYRIAPSERKWTTQEENKLAAWFAKHPQEKQIQRIVLDDGTYYATIVSADEYTSYEGGIEPYVPGWHYLAYIDTVAERSLIATVNSAFAVIGVVGVLLASGAGYIAGKRIDEAQDAQKRFYENMSHDLKTPLAAIRGFAEGASSGVLDTTEATAAIVRETDRMTETINQILGLSRLEAGAVKPVKEPLVVGDFVQDCLMPLEGAVRARGLTVDLELADGEVMADPNLFDHALSNVLTNAVRHAASRMLVNYDGERLCVWNDGDVPDAAELPQLFDRFHAGAGGSTGIGLAIAKEIAGLHGWSIAARCVDGGLEVAFVF